MNWLPGLYAFCLPFVEVVRAPWVGSKIQPTEIVFLALFAYSLYQWGWRRLFRLPRLLGMAVSAYVASNWLSALLNGSASALLEGTGRTYLAVLFLVIYQWVRLYGRGHWLMWMFVYGTILQAAITYYGYGLAVYAGEMNGLVQIYADYPYFGTVMRASGLTPGSGMLIMVLLLAVLFTWREWLRGRCSAVWWLMLLPLAAITFSKEFVLILLGMLLSCSGWPRLRLVAFCGGAVMFWLATHFVVEPQGAEGLEGTQYVSGRVAWQSESFRILETSYSALKRAGWQVAAEQWAIGTGPGQFSTALDGLRLTGDYPAHLPDYDPHSTWLGAWSETGILGFAALSLFVIACYRSADRDLGVLGRGGIGAFLLMVLILSVSKDVANFRFVWFALAIWVAARPAAVNSDDYAPVA